jgi:hypothetical protein
MNLSNTVAVVVFEAWRQNGLPAAPDTARVPALQLVRAHFGQQFGGGAVVFEFDRHGFAAIGHHRLAFGIASIW